MKQCLVKLAELDARGLVITKDQAANDPGHSLEELETYGITKGDLTRLERLGRAVKGYVNSGHGYQKRYLLLKESNG